MRVVLGVTGSAAAFKAVAVASGLLKTGFEVEVVLTEAALRFVTPMAFQTLTHRPARADLFAEDAPQPLHIELARWAEAMLVAPATANTLVKLAHGVADNLLCATALALPESVFRAVAPAMEERMYLSPPVQRALKQLENDEWMILEPVRGHLASGEVGLGRMVEPDVLVAALAKAIGEEGEA